MMLGIWRFKKVPTGLQDEDALVRGDTVNENKWQLIYGSQVCCRKWRPRREAGGAQPDFS